LFHSISSCPSKVIKYLLCRKKFYQLICHPQGINYFIWIDDWPCEEQPNVYTWVHLYINSLEQFLSFSSSIKKNYFFFLSDLNCQMCEKINSLVDDIILVCYQIWSIDMTGCVHSWQNLWTYCQRLSLAQLHLTFLPSPISPSSYC